MGRSPSSGRSVAQSPPSPVKLMAALLLFLTGAYVVLSCYANPVALKDTPLLTTRGDAAVSLLVLQRMAADNQRATMARHAAPLPPQNRTAAAADLLGKEPLSPDALLLVGGAFASAAAREQARPLVAEALRRDPRSRGARAWGIVDAAMSRRFADAVRGFERLLSIAPKESEVAVPLIALLINDREARQVLLASLNRPRSWHAALSGQIAQSNLPIDVVEQFAAVLVRHPDPGTRQAILGALVNRGAHGRAYALWRSQLPANIRPARPQVNAPDFGDFPGGYPFAWTLSQDGGDGAVQADGGGIEIRYSGQRALTLASQMLVMPPGQYSLTVSGGGRPLKAAGLEWVIRCVGDSTLLGKIDLGALSATQREARADITVPSSCHAQTLSLIGTASLFPTESVFTVRSVNLIAR